MGVVFNPTSFEKNTPCLIVRGLYSVLTSLCDHCRTPDCGTTLDRARCTTWCLHINFRVGMLCRAQAFSSSDLTMWMAGGILVTKHERCLGLDTQQHCTVWQRPDVHFDVHTLSTFLVFGFQRHFWKEAPMINII